MRVSCAANSFICAGVVRLNHSSLVCVAIRSASLEETWRRCHRPQRYWNVNIVQSGAG